MEMQPKSRFKTATEGGEDDDGVLDAWMALRLVLVTAFGGCIGFDVGLDMTKGNLRQPATKDPIGPPNDPVGAKTLPKSVRRWCSATPG